MRSILIALPLVLLAGCSSFRGNPEDIKPVPEDRLLAFQEAQENGAQIVVNRDFGMMGGGCYVAIEVDRKVAARIGVGEVATFQVRPGTRVVGITPDRMDDTLCGMGRLLREVAVPVKAGEVQHLRIVSQNKGGFDIRPDKP
ncbi:PQQ-binding-like beta-propeller repeat protein [Ectopseudomonas mendocina]|uniref:3-isopropylmalate dehydratase n=1 Tax=Ectopseudomonas mendocina S5.2 TaxID=1225174 RepID=A0ABM5VYM9_ECTME|nr:3-isopropylmalate dehydratase large subunit [Pseudomonas mendocina]ALN20029.1 3-isopropylmalate dehydratase [Pseudomonas mendocina S5.2]KER99074.1 3-isopropylmalate dehydratase [Pseudomonas mendocina]